DCTKPSGCELDAAEGSDALEPPQPTRSDASANGDAKAAARAKRANIVWSFRKRGDVSERSGARAHAGRRVWDGPEPSAVRAAARKVPVASQPKHAVALP